MWTFTENSLEDAFAKSIIRLEKVKRSKANRARELLHEKRYPTQKGKRWQSRYKSTVLNIEKDGA